MDAIIEEIIDKEGGELHRNDLYQRRPTVQEEVLAKKFDIIPSRGQLLRHNGNGIRHAKYSPSKNIAVIWENIRGTIYITFDDHAPIRYHRAITHLRDIRLGKPVKPRHARTSGGMLRKLKRHWKMRYYRKLKGVDLRAKYYE